MVNEMMAVLFSGGVESTYCLLHHCRMERVLALFFEYGQPYLTEERASVRSIAGYLDVELETVVLDDIAKVGEIYVDRNATLIKHARAYCDRISIGSRALFSWMDSYGDCNRTFCDRMERDLYCRIEMPCLMKPKWLLRSRIKKASQEIYNSIYSSENFHKKRRT